MGELHYSRTFGPELQVIFFSGRAGRAFIAAPRREGTADIRLSSPLSLLFLGQCGRHELVGG